MNNNADTPPINSNDASRKLAKKLNKKYKTNRRWVFFWSVMSALVAVIIIGTIMSNTRTDTDAGETVTKIRALTCKSSDYFYPFFTFDQSSHKDFKIIITFAGEDVRSLSLQQILYYSDEDLKTTSEAENHAALNKQFGLDRMDADSLGASYAITSDGVRFSLYSTVNQLDFASAKYYLIDKIEKYDYNNIRQAYISHGLECDSDK